MPFLKIFVTYFSGTTKARKAKVCINMDNDWIYCVYRIRGQGSIILGIMSLGRFSKKLKCILLNNFYVCSPTLMKLISHLGALKNCMDTALMYLVFRNQGHGPITHGLKSFDRIYNTMLPCWSYLVRMNSKYFNTICISPLIALQRSYSQVL